MRLDTVYEMICDDCGSEFEIATSEENEHEPMYCPFCGNEIPDEAEYEDDEDEDFFEDLEQFEDKE